MVEKLPPEEQLPKVESQRLKPEEQEVIFADDEKEKNTQAEQAKKEEKLNPEKIDRLKKELEEHEIKETAEECDLRVQRELEKILSSDDSKDRDERMKNFLREKKAEGVKVNINYEHEPESVVKKFYHSITGERTFRPLSAYIYHNSYKSLDELNSDIFRDRENTPELDGVTGVEEVELENGEKGYLVRIDKKKWPSLMYVGFALPRRGIAFIPDGFSQGAEKAITDHEVYHLNNHKPPRSEGIVAKFFRELDAIWNTNIKKNFIGSVSLQVQGFINLPNAIKNVLENFIK